MWHLLPQFGISRGDEVLIFIPRFGFRRGIQIEPPHVGCYADEGDAREVAFQVLGETRAVGGMMQHGIDVMKNVRRRDAVVIVENLEQRPRFGRDVFLLVLAVFGIGEQRKTLCVTGEVEIGNNIDANSVERAKRCPRQTNE